MSDAIATELVCYQAIRFLPLAFQQLSKEPLGGTAISPRLDQDVDDIAILMDCSP